MSDPTEVVRQVREICQAWIDVGMGDECFWEGWPGEPTGLRLTPEMVLASLPAVQPQVTVDQLAQIIRAVDGYHTLGARKLAERILAAITLSPNPVDDSREADAGVKPLADPRVVALVEAADAVLSACDDARMVSGGVGGMTIEASIRGSSYNGVKAWPIEEMRAALASVQQTGAIGEAGHE